MKNEAVHAMVVAPHPHDAEYAIAGKVAQWKREGKETVFVVCTSGEKGTIDPSIHPGELAKMREEEQIASAKLLGVSKCILLRRPDLGLEETLEFKHEILRLILMYRPEIVVTCDPFYPVRLSNPDHRVTGRVVLDAVWPYALSPNAYRDLQDEGLQLHMVKEVWLFQTEEPDLRFDISNVFDIKMAAVECHKSTVGDPIGAEFADRIKEMAMRGAKGQDYRFGEAFLRLEVLQRL
ncbi:PIG-L deacetylase family protein [Chloroflexota bacterium]